MIGNVKNILIVLVPALATLAFMQYQNAPRKAPTPKASVEAENTEVPMFGNTIPFLQTPQATITTTNGAACLAGRSIRRGSAQQYKTAFINITMPSMVGKTPVGAQLILQATTNNGPMNNLDVYARAVSETGAWDNSSVVATFLALSLGTAAITGQTLTASVGNKYFDIWGDATKGIQKFYADHPGGGDITIAVDWSAYPASTPNGVTANLTVGDDDVLTPKAVFAPYDDVTGYPRIQITYTD